MENKKHYLIKVNPIKGDEDFLVALEGEKIIPFPIKRVFYEYNLNEESIKGRHANRNSRFCLIAISGSCDVTVVEKNRETNYKLDDPSKILYLDKMVWKTMHHFSKGSVLLALSDQPYDSKEYIRDFNEYLKAISDEQ